MGAENRRNRKKPVAFPPRLSYIDITAGERMVQTPRGRRETMCRKKTTPKSRRIVPFNTGTRVHRSKRDKARTRAALNRETRMAY
jgi:hypothetical protein